MSETGKDGQVNIGSEIVAIREAVRTQLSATDEVKKRTTATEIVREFSERDADLHEAVQKLHTSTETGRAGERVQISMVKIFELISQIFQGKLNRDQVFGIDPTKAPEKSLRIIQKIDEKIGGRLSERSAVFIYSLINRLLQKELSIDELQSEFNNIRQSLNNPTITRCISEALIEAATDNILNISADEARNKFEARDETAKRDLNQRLLEISELQRKMDWVRLDPEEIQLIRKFNDKPYTTYSAAELDRFNQVFQKMFKTDQERQAKRYIELSQGLTEREIESLVDNVLRQDLQFDSQEMTVVRTYFDNPETILKLARNGRLSSEDAQNYKMQIMRIFNKLYDRIDKAPNQHFASGFSDFYEGRVFRYLKGKLEALENALRSTNITIIHEKPVEVVVRDQNGNLESRTIVKRASDNVVGFIDSIIKEANIENRWREVYHDIWIYSKNSALVEKWRDYIVNLPVSEVSLFLSGPGGELVELARSAFERYLSYDIAINGNVARPELLSGLFDPTQGQYDLPDYTAVREYFKKSLVERGINPDDPNISWQIERSLTIARGISFINTLRVPEIIASAFPETSFKGNSLFDLAAFVNPQWNWGWGRGGAPTGYQLEVPELRAIDVVTKPEGSFLTRGRWVPKEVSDKAKGLFNEAELKLNREWLDKHHLYGKLLRIFGIGGFHSRGSWRVDGLKRLREDINNELKAVRRENEGKVDMTDDTWYDDILVRKVGAAARWYYDLSPRVEDELKPLFGKRLQEKGIIKCEWKDLPKDDQNSYWAQYKGGEMDIEMSEFGMQDSTLSELLDLRENQYRGDTFYYLLKRSPIDFIINMMQLVPETGAEKLGDKKLLGDDNLLDGFDYWFTDDLDNVNKFNTQDRETIRRFQSRQKQKWGEGNYQYIKRIAQFWHDVNSSIGDEVKKDLERESRDLEETEAERAVRVKTNLRSRILAKVRDTMTAAIQTVQKDERLEMRPEDIKDDKLREIFFGSDGFISFFKEAGDRNRLLIKGEKDKPKTKGIDQSNFFYRLGRIWFKEEEVGVFPTSAEIDHRKIYQYIAMSGENMNARLAGDIPRWQETMKGIINLDHMLIAAASAHNLQEIYKLHNQLIELKDIIGERKMHEAQYYLASLVTRFFQEHHVSKLPFYVGAIARLTLGREVSLSKLSHAGRTAFSLTSDGINTYFQRLRNMNALAEHGPWSFDQITNAFAVEWKTLLATEIIPNVAFSLLLFLLYQYFKKAMGEAEGKKK